MTKLQIKLDFAKPAMDGIDLKGMLAVPEGFSPAGATLQVSVGGVVKSFTLDTKGKAKVGTDQAQAFNATVTGAAVTIAVEMVMNGTTDASAQPQLSTAKTGKSGKTR